MHQLKIISFLYINKKDFSEVLWSVFELKQTESKVSQ